MKGNSFNDIQSIKELGLYDLYEGLRTLFCEKFGSSSTIRFRFYPQGIDAEGFLDYISGKEIEKIDDIYLYICISINQENPDPEARDYEPDDTDIAWALTRLEYAIDDIVCNKGFKIDGIDVNGGLWSKKISLTVR